MKVQRRSETLDVFQFDAKVWAKYQEDHSFADPVYGRIRKEDRFKVEGYYLDGVLIVDQEWVVYGRPGSGVFTFPTMEHLHCEYMVVGR
jgi:hypothetical protein